jgi:hypothetical protein
VPAAAETPRHGQDFLIVEAALDDHVDLDRAESGGFGGLDALQHIGNRHIHVVHGPEDGVVEGVEADGDALEAGGLEGRGLLGQQHAVGGEGHLHVGNLDQLGDELFQVAAQQRLAAGEADLGDAMGRKKAGEAGDFLEGQQGFPRQEGVVLVEHGLRHAIHAAEVAAVGHRDAQILDRAAAAVEELPGGGRKLGGDRRQLPELTLVGEGNHSLGHCLVGPCGRVPLIRPSPASAPCSGARRESAPPENYGAPGGEGQPGWKKGETIIDAGSLRPAVASF